MKSEETWRSIEITVQPEAVEAIEFALNSLEAQGTAINQLRRLPTDPVTVVGYFTSPPESETLQDELHYALRSYGLDEDAILTMERRDVENADWLAEWKRHWKPTEVSKFVIAPPWEENVDTGDRFLIRIEPNMAFGTGTHETTKLCLAMIAERFRPGDSFLDVGTGTGILAIAAAMLSSDTKNISGYDTDLDSIKLAKENAVLNGVAERISFFDGPINNATPEADVVLANLTIDVILPILDLLLAKTKRTLIMSGILGDQRPLIEAALAERGITGEVQSQGEWISVTVDKD